jgi:ectoine hydroxylase-related dioxygenase (phytanoyl-CoA dioxygenase family)
MKVFTEEQVRRYRHDGFIYPVPGLTPEQAAQAMTDLERVESRIGMPISKADLKWRGASYVYAPWAEAIVRNPRILDAVEDLIGPDILVFWSTFFIKEPGTPSFTAWHQDATYFGLEPLEHVTAWVALSDAGQDAGCLEVLSSQGAPLQMKHSAARLEHSINGVGQTIVGTVDDREAQAMSLRAGEMSLHHTLCKHRSPPNKAKHRRIGLGISYIPTHVKPTGSYRPTAMLVRGQDRWGHFDPVRGPDAELSPSAIAAHEEVHKAFREHCGEQHRLHEAAFA